MKKIFLLIVTAHLLLLSLLNFTAWPEMLSYPYLFAHGFTLYKDYIMPYPPLLIWFLTTVFNITGYNPIALKLITWILIILVDLLLFSIIHKIIKSISLQLLLMLSYVLLQSLLDGNMLWFDFATVLPLLCAFYFLLNWLKVKDNLSLFLIALFLSLAVMIKQVAIIYLVTFALIYIWQEKKNVLASGIYFLLGIILAVTPLFVSLIFQNMAKEFWQWAIIYPLTEWPKFPGYVNYRIPLRELLMTVVLMIPILGLIFKVKKVIKDPVLVSSTLFLLAAVVAIYPRFSYFHLQPVLVFWVILIGQLYLLQGNFLKKLYLFFIFAVIFSGLVLTFKQAMGSNIRFYETSEKQMAAVISGMTSPSERTYLLGLNSSLYAYSDTLPPKNWGDNFGWYLEIPGVQKWVILGMEQTPPNLIFWKKPKSGNWFDLGVYQPGEIASYIKTYYHKIGEIETGVEIWQRK